MSEPDRASPPANVNVTLDAPLTGRLFPCPLCGLGLDLRLSRADKPYCVCDVCGVQLFIRGKLGIGRLQDLIDREQRVSGTTSASGSAVVVFNRLQQLRAHKQALDAQQGLIFVDEDLAHAICAVDREMHHMQDMLNTLANPGRSR
jgi:hypothetical protein